MASTAMESVDLALVVTGLQVVSVGKFIGEGACAYVRVHAFCAAV